MSPEAVEEQNTVAEAAKRSAAIAAASEPSAADSAERYAKDEAAKKPKAPPKGADGDRAQDVRDLASVIGDATAAKRKAGVGDHQAKYSLDLDDRRSLVVRLGGELWEAVEPTIAVNMELTMALPSLSDDADQGEQARQALASIYPQVAHILRSVETGESPSREFVESHLTGRNFGVLMERLNEEAQEGNA